MRCQPGRPGNQGDAAAVFDRVSTAVVPSISMPDDDVSSMHDASNRGVPEPAGVKPSEDATVISRGDAAALSWSGPGPMGRATTAEIGRVLEGTMLGPYRLDHFIGGGGMGAVFRALDTTLDRVVAVKVLAAGQADDEEMLKRFRNEAQSAARLDHENIGRVHAVGSDEGWHYIVFEFIEGTNLRDLVRDEGAFDLARTVDVAIQVADALEHASEREVVHRDIKPSNIVITPAGKARLVDMGLARLHQVADDRDLTMSGMTLGTFDYISPEQARDPRAADVRSDLYSLGCTIFFMLAGRPPFAEGTLVQKLLQHQQAAPPAIDEIRPDVPHAFEEILHRLMEKDPADRYQRPAVLVADLVAFAEEHQLSVSTPRLAGPVVDESSGSLLQRVPWLVPVAALLAIVAGLWIKTAAERRATSPSAPWRGASSSVRSLVTVVAANPGDGEAVSLFEAIGMVADGGVVELAYDGVRNESPLVLDGRTIVVRAAPGSHPIIEFAGALPSLTSGRMVACDIGNGELDLRGVGLRLAAAASPGDGAALFGIRSGRLSCHDVTLRMPGDPAGRLPLAVIGRPAFVAVSSTNVDCVIVMDQVRAAGDAAFLDASSAGAGRIAMSWSGGAFVSPRRLMVAEGTTTGELEVDGELEGVAVACGAGIVLLRDSSSRPVPTRVRLKAIDSRFVVGDRAKVFVEQVGRADTEAYRSAVEWSDDQSRYEGGAMFRRIDAATERLDEAFRDLVPPLSYESIPGAVPDPTVWPGWGG